MTFLSQGGHVPTTEGQPDLPCPLHPHPKPRFQATTSGDRWGTSRGQLGEVLQHPALPRGTVVVRSRLLPRPQLRVRELGPAWAALPACTSRLRDQADGIPGTHCAGRLVPPATGGAQRCQAHQQPRDLALLVLLSADSQEEQGRHRPPAQPSSAWRLEPFPTPPAACRSRERSPWPRWVAWTGSKPEQQGASQSSRDAEPLGSSLARSGDVGGSPPAASTHSPLPAMGQDGAIGQEAVSNATGHQ